jgi:DNA-binding response OmpR family regulator
MAGPELARALRDFFTVPTLFLSAYDDPEIVTAALQEGSLGLIVKPLETTSLLPALQIALTRARDMQAHTPRNGLRRYVYAYWQQLLSMGHRLLDSTNDTREIDAAILRSRRARNASRVQSNQETERDSSTSPACASRRHNAKH